MSLGYALGQVTRNVYTAALLADALHHQANGVCEALVGIADHKLDASQTELLLLCRSLQLEGANEFTPNRLALASTRLEDKLFPTPSAFIPSCTAKALELSCSALTTRGNTNR